MILLLSCILGALMPASSQYIAKFHRRAAFALALVSRLHERKNLDGFFRLHRRNAGLEKFHDLSQQRRVAVERPGGCLALFTFGQAVEAFVCAKNTFTPAAPKAGDFNSAVGRGRALYSLAAGSEHSKQSFDAVDAVPEQVGMMRLQLAGAASLHVGDLADETLVHGLGVFGKAQSRGAEYRDVGLLREPKNLADIPERCRHRLVNENRLARFQA